MPDYDTDFGSIDVQFSIGCKYLTLYILLFSAFLSIFLRKIGSHEENKLLGIKNEVLIRLKNF